MYNYHNDWLSERLDWCNKNIINHRYSRENYSFGFTDAQFAQIIQRRRSGTEALEGESDIHIHFSAKEFAENKYPFRTNHSGYSIPKVMVDAAVVEDNRSLNAAVKLIKDEQDEQVRNYD